MSALTALRATVSSAVNHTGDTAWTTVTGATISSGSLTVGHVYLIKVIAVVTYSSSANLGSVRLVHGSTSFADSEENRRFRSSPSNVKVYSYPEIWTAVSGEDIHLEYACGNAADTITADNVEIIAIDINSLTSGTDYIYSYDGTTEAFSSNSWTTTNNASVSPPSTGTWLIEGFSRCNLSDTSVSLESRITSSGDFNENVPISHFEVGFASTEYVLTHLSRAFVLTTASNTFTQEARKVVTYASGNRTHSKMIALKLDIFDDFATTWDATGATLSTTAYATQLASISVAPSTASDIFAQGQATQDTGSYADRMLLREQIDNADFFSGWTTDAYETNALDAATDIREVQLSHLVTGQTAAAHTVDLDGSSNAANTASQISLVAFTLELAGGGGTVINRTLSDSVDVVDLIANNNEVNRLLNDSVDVFADIERILSIRRILFENLDVHDSLFSTVGYWRKLQDSVSVYESILTVKSLVRILQENVDVEDAKVRLLEKIVVLFDQIGVSDSISTYLSGIIVRLLSDYVDVTDSALPSIEFIRLLSDNADVSYGLLIDKIKSRLLSDNISVDDQLTRLMALRRLFSESVDVTDSSTVVITRAVSILLHILIGMQGPDIDIDMR